jgi:hypothetical protein
VSKRCEIGRECPRHYEQVHGGEAEELRSAFEELRDSYNRKQGADANIDAGDVAHALTVILDRVDARDSLAWLEMRKRQQGRKKAEVPRG